MPDVKTVNSYVSDQGELVLTVDAGMTGLTLFTTAEPIILDGVVRKFSETQPRTRNHSETYVTGANAPIATMSTKQTATKWTLIIVDDYSKGLAGEWGTDLLAAGEMFEAVFDGNINIDEMSVTPAGGGVLDIETTLTNIEIESISHPETDADSTTPQEITIVLVVESFTKAAHA